jgi:dihydropteroate synthase
MEQKRRFDLRLVEVHNSAEAGAAVSGVKASAGGVKQMAPKAVHRVIRVERISTKAAIILKQEMLANGGDASISRDAGDFSDPETGVLLMGTLKQYHQVCNKLQLQPFGLRQLSAQIRDVLANLEPAGVRELQCRDRRLTLGERTLVMGILNVTPDSFSDGGQFYDLEKAVAHAREMVAQGADIIDVGGESTRPSTWDQSPLSAEGEIARIIPVVERLVKEIEVPISVDTYKAATGRAAMQAGAHIINDIWGFQREADLAMVAAEYDAPVILMHNKDDTQYQDLIGEIFTFLSRSIQIAEDAGIKPENIILDPGIGFGKDRDQNLEVLRRLGEFRSLGKPILLGTSRKSVIGKTLDLPSDQRLEGTIATNVWGIEHGADIIRVHDVREHVRAARMTDAIIRS